jgi:tetratricopeptide (TPR) repeat protein
LKRLPEANTACERALAINQSVVEESHGFNGTTASSLEGGLAETYFRSGQVRRDLKKLSGAASHWREALSIYKKATLLQNEEEFIRGCCHAGLAELAGLPDSSVTTEERESQFSRSIECLRKAIDLGYRSPVTYLTESALDPLRDRDDFKKLMSELDEKAAADQASLPGQKAE